MLAWPGVALGTAEVYAALPAGARAAERVEELAAAPFATRERRAARGARRERSRGAGRELCPAIAGLRAQLLAGGALTACLSGSGSAVFGLFAAEGAAEAARERDRGDRAVDGVARLPRADAGATITA